MDIQLQQRERSESQLHVCKVTMNQLPQVCCLKKLNQCKTLGPRSCLVSWSLFCVGFDPVCRFTIGSLTRVGVCIFMWPLDVSQRFRKSDTEFLRTYWEPRVRCHWAPDPWLCCAPCHLGTCLPADSYLSILEIYFLCSHPKVSQLPTTSPNNEQNRTRNPGIGCKKKTVWMKPWRNAISAKAPKGSKRGHPYSMDNPRNVRERGLDFQAHVVFLRLRCVCVCDSPAMAVQDDPMPWTERAKNSTEYVSPNAYTTRAMDEMVLWFKQCMGVKTLWTAWLTIKRIGREWLINFKRNFPPVCSKEKSQEFETFSDSTFLDTNSRAWSLKEKTEQRNYQRRSKKDKFLLVSQKKGFWILLQMTPLHTPQCKILT